MYTLKLRAYTEHNPNGLASDDRARSAYLRSLRAAFPVVALVETHRKPAQEALWAREWGSGQTFWSSLDAPIAQCGVALLFADTVDVADASAHHDADGRLLVVTGTLYRNHKMLFIVSYAPSGSDTENRDFFTDIPAFVKARVSDWDKRHIVWLGDHNSIPHCAR